ncbi:hypothetical protein MLD38_010631 [Melastoma candidum]|uniref:Uncharacterized protein n=1 Tax=Melastoma candidum TaxID=119954 RepID=A0ACB9R4K3_9MYRT|nr:hypothetical protein MLD38_010631 [Melastoma candidum]
MAYMDEEEVWKCPSHPTRRRRRGVCPACLSEKLSILCPDCGAPRPCSCSSSASSSSSASQFFSFYCSSSTVPDRSVTGKISHLIDSEPSFRRSRSVATFNLPSFLRSRSKFAGRDTNPDVTTSLPTTSAARSVTGSSFWGKFRRDRSKRVDDGISVDEEHNGNCVESRKGRSWSRYFPSPMKVFGSHRHSIPGSPLYRG